MRCRETAASVSSGGIAARALDASVCARSTSNGVASPARWRAVTRRSVSSSAAEIARDGFELPQCATEHEVVACDIGQHEQAHATRAVLDGESIGVGRFRPRPQATGDIDFPRNANAAAPDVGVGDGLPFDGVIACVGVSPAPTALMLGSSQERLIVAPARAARTRAAAILTSRFSYAARPMRSESTGSP